MGRDEKYIELRVAYPGHPYVAVLGGRSSQYAFQRIFNPFYIRRERLHDGRQQQIHHLPDADLTYEIQEGRGSDRVIWYAATLKGDPEIHRLCRHGALMVAKGLMSIREAIREHPEMPPIEVDED